jgi:hypothetical protein
LSALNLHFWRVGRCLRRSLLRQVEARHANAIVSHPIIEVEAIRRAQIVTPVDAGGEYNIGDNFVTFLWQHRICRSIADHARVLL